MIKLLALPGAASLAPHILLIEIGVPFELRFVDRDAGEHKSPAYLALNPNGLIPVLVDGDLVMYETVAIGLHLADTHPAAGLAPALGTAERAHYFKWMVWLTNTMQALLIHYFYPERMVDDGHAEGVAQVKAHAQARVQDCLVQIDDQLAGHGGPWLLGAQYSAADAYAFMLCRWTRNFSQGSAGPSQASLLPAGGGRGAAQTLGLTGRPAREHPHIAPYLQRMLARPAVQRAFATEGLQPPLV